MRSTGPEVSDQPAAYFNWRLGALVPLKQTSKHLLLIFLIFCTFQCLSISVRIPFINNRVRTKSNKQIDYFDIFAIFIEGFELRKWSIWCLDEPSQSQSSIDSSAFHGRNNLVSEESLWSLSRSFLDISTKPNRILYIATFPSNGWSPRETYSTNHILMKPYQKPSASFLTFSYLLTPKPLPSQPLSSTS